eukprot:COSAG02_NODE_341_length_24173_cov_28.504777_8_plen_616_part_00
MLAQQVRGVCRLSAPLVLGPLDSHVRWEGGAVSGGVEVSGWKEAFRAPCAGCGAVWVADLPAVTGPARQLWVNGVRANRTQMRFPQQAAVKTNTGMNTTVGANWTRAAAIEMVYAGNQFCLGKALRNPSSPNFFTWQRVPVTAVHDTEIVLSPTALSHIPLVPRQAELGLPCWVENVFELLGDNSTGRVGDYYHDLTAQKLYYVSPDAPSGVVLPQTSALITLKNATGVSFANTTFMDTTWLFGEDGYTQIQAGCTNRKDRLAVAPADEDPSTVCLPTPAAVEVVGSREIYFSGCTFRNLGTTGVHFSGGAHDNAVSRSQFFDLSASAVLFGSVNTYNISDPKQQDAGLMVADCTIHNVGHEYPGNCGITAYYSRGLRILHNEIYDIPYTGISVGWGWDFTQQKTWPRMPWDSDNVIAGNDIHHVMTRLGDGGMIYTLGPQGNRPFLRPNGGGSSDYPPEPEAPLQILPMSQILNNYLHDNGPSSSSSGGQKVKALYSDAGSTNWNISGNVIENNAGPNFVWMSGCREASINNSWSDNSYSCTVVHGKTLGPHGRISECCDSGCSGWRNNDTICPLNRSDLNGHFTSGTTNYTGQTMPAAAKATAAAAGPRRRRV